MQQKRNKCGDHIPAFLCPESGTSFDSLIPSCGHFHLRPLALDTDVPFIHEWVNKPYAVYWQLQNSTVEKVRNMYSELICTEHIQPFMGFYNDKPAFLVEFYWAFKDRIGEYYDVQTGDYGFHILMAPADTPVRHFTWNVFTVLIDFMFSEEKVERLIVEPDARNEKIHLLNKRAGFEYHHLINLPEKTAHLAFCTREQYTSALERERQLQSAGTI
ncbi:GNAT family N-acetyltransferase [Chitinophaga filiformis]|uniref:Protein N-acetyltransferase, RimJ/RimL family n=1 Tax=Chitinophaga filiformis TaxID=104663 RepID=A0A1G7RIG8_CHIFI|nr:GNAT family N-acetyltransferase [Chitinophaga filiformis]SDG10616.1 Protein N-acetyltransferase, RimJ/RimL family [Chitinophaga filiformis]